jgi:NAD(P)-dependent dehydrogenase (short-subunit alcohol dehydrogenase family)
MSRACPLVVVITGASGGVGRSVVRRFAKRRDVQLALIARGAKGLEGARREAEEAGTRAIAIQADVADANAVEAAAEAIETQLGPIDIWINVAMTTVFGPFMSVTPDEFKRVTEVTYLGYVYGTQAALKRMIPRNSGTIVQVGSSVAYRGIPLQTAYSGAKHAIQGFTEALRTELMHDKKDIHLTMVQLPAMDTPQFGWCKNTMPRKWQPVPPIYDPDMVARTIEWAAFHHDREYYATESTWKVILADKLIPGYVEHFLAEKGYDSQLYDGDNDPEKPNNLWAPIDEDRGSRGEFSSRSRKWSAQVWCLTHPWLLRGMLAAVATSMVAGMLWWCRSEDS